MKTATASRTRPEMGITSADFSRIFPRLFDPGQCVVELARDGARVSWPDGRRLAVKLSPERIRAIALLRIPYVDLAFEFRGFDAVAADEFMARFDRAFHKGGG
ncbi:MAG: hypothetical protein AB7Q81_16815 [Gammaproteobacteria bacterium]